MDLHKVNNTCRWQDLTEGMQIYEGGTSQLFMNTG